ncbi:hypothetical protein ITJ64_05435 [Herbiconiux sp. VKM Ac-1786]|uniref:hypothetical protein n=1 Tax=Herbiconiux sp. VKM Ac-1786 TaxID=2783824 RepID=UPI00188B3C4B|nr:hypothetical protein [Herbiconiux sp. VKM Ac-1786]MBF4571954.1 hypothetical protein [Herbiconiux sp. VKM Ac-1786]
MTMHPPITHLPTGGTDVVYPGDEAIQGRLHTEPDARGLIVIAYPTAFSRFGRNDEHLCTPAHQHGYSTLSVDLLTPEETTVSPDAVHAHLVRRLASVLEDSRRRGQTGLCVFAIGAAAPAALPASDHQDVTAIATCALPGVVSASDDDVDRAGSRVLECTPTLGTTLTWDDVDQSMRRALVWFDAALSQRRQEIT